MSTLQPKGPDQTGGNDAEKPLSPLEAWRARTRELLGKTGALGQTRATDPEPKPQTPAERLREELDATDPAGVVDGLRKELAGVNAAASVSRNETILQAKRRLITPAVAKIYVSAAVRAVAEMRRRQRGTSSQDDGIDRTEAGKIANTLENRLNKLQIAVPRFFSDKEDNLPQARVLIMPNADKGKLRRNWQAGVAQAEGAESTRLAEAINRLQAGAEEAEIERWAALGVFRETFGKQDGQGNWSLGPSAAADHTQLLDAYVDLVETLDGIRGGALVKVRGGSTPLSTVNLKARGQTETAGTGVAPSANSMASVMERAGAAIATLGPKQKKTWDALMASPSNTIVVGGYEFIGGTAGLMIIPPHHRKLASFRVEAQNFSKAMDTLQQLLDDKVPSGARLPQIKEDQIEAALQGREIA